MSDDPYLTSRENSLDITEKHEEHFSSCSWHGDPGTLASSWWRHYMPYECRPLSYVYTLRLIGPISYLGECDLMVYPRKYILIFSRIYFVTFVRI